MQKRQWKIYGIKYKDNSEQNIKRIFEFSKKLILSKINPEVRENVEFVDLKLGDGYSKWYILDEKIGDSKLASKTKDNEEIPLYSDASCKVIIKLKNEDKPTEYTFIRAGVSTEDEGGYLVVPSGMSKEEMSKWLQYAPSVSAGTYDIIAAAKTLEIAEEYAREENDYTQVGMNAPWKILRRGIKQELINSATKAVYDRENEMLIIGELKGEEDFKYDFDKLAQNIIDETEYPNTKKEESYEEKMKREIENAINAKIKEVQEQNNDERENKQRTGFVAGLHFKGEEQVKNEELDDKSSIQNPPTFNGR